MNNQLQVQPQSGFVNINNMQDAFQFAEMLSQSNMVPKIYIGKSADIVIAMQMGAELGLKPLQSLQNIAVVNGRPTIWGDAVVAICQNSGLLEDITEVVTDTEATVTVTRTGQAPHSVTFSMEDAKKAGLAGKTGPWTQYPKRMMKNRARAFALRDKFADVLSGFGITEEEKDRVIDVTPSRSQAPAPINSSVNAALQSLPSQLIAEASVIEYFNPNELLESIGKITDIQQVRPVGEEIAKLVKDAAINIKSEDVDKLRKALSDKKANLVFDGLMNSIENCQSLDDADRLENIIEDKKAELPESKIKSLQEALNRVSEEIGAQG